MPGPGAGARCALCGGAGGLARRSLAALRPHPPLAETDVHEWVCSYCWVRACRCIKFMECVRTSDLALSGVAIKVEQNTFPKYSITHQRTFNICDQNECQTIPDQIVQIQSQQTLLYKPDLNEINNSKCVLKNETTEDDYTYCNSVNAEVANEYSNPFHHDIELKIDPESPDLKPMFDELESKIVEQSTSMNVGQPESTIIAEEPECTIVRLYHQPITIQQLKTNQSPLEQQPELERTEEELKEFNIDVIYLNKEEKLKALAEKKLSAKYLSSKYKCDKCGFATDDEVTYDNHNIKHDWSSGWYVCEICSTRHKTNYSLNLHEKVHACRLRCRRCGETIPYKSLCKLHYEMCAKIGGVDCPECGKKYLNSRSMQQHVKKQHRTAKRYECDHCGYKVKEKFSLVEHMHMHSDVAPYRCDLCGKKIKSIKKLNAHIKNHEPKVVDQDDDNYCVECDHVFKHKSTYMAHLKTSLRHVAKDSFRFQCSECPRRFHNPSGRKHHVNAVHLKKRTHQCTLCEKGFASSHVLLRHVREKHSTGERPRNAICDVCGKGFYTPKILKQHVVAVHFKERPFACPLCPATFGFSAALYTHNKLKHLKQARIIKKKAK